MLYEIGRASELTMGVSPHPWRENIVATCGLGSNRRKLLVGEINIHC